MGIGVSPPTLSVSGQAKRYVICAVIYTTKNLYSRSFLKANDEDN